MRFTFVLPVVWFVIVFASPQLGGAEASGRAVAEVSEDRQVENLAAFARVYGYVRFFHPSDQAQSVDWDKVAVLGAGDVRAAPDPAALAVALRGVFQPIAPRLRLISDGAPSETPAPIPPARGRVTFWQHLGLKLTDQPGVYRQQRAITGETRGDRAALFRPAEPPPLLMKTLAPGLVLELPLALPVDAAEKTPAELAAEFAALQARLAEFDAKSLTPADARVPVAGVVTTWSAFQHFHPYLDTIGVNWDEALGPALRRALHATTTEEYRLTLSELVAKTRDGHGYVIGPPGPIGGMPIRVARVEDKIVITGVAGDAPFRKGDVIERLAGVPALEVLRERERHSPGSPHLSEFRALNQFGAGPLGSTVRVDLQRDGAGETIEFVRSTPDRRMYFFNSIGEFSFPAFAEVRPGIFYVNLYSLDAPDLAAKLPQLAHARGVIFDQRWDGRNQVTAKSETIQPAEHIIPHLIGETIQASPMLIPQIRLPDRAGWSYDERTWPVRPKSPRLKGRIVFINEPSVVSYGETCMAMIAHHRLATLVGAPTAGCNGNVNFIPLPGGFRVMWTGMDVRKHDRSSFYTVGFAPDFPVARTLEAVKAGRDEYLEKAIAVIENATPVEQATARKSK